MSNRRNLGANRGFSALSPYDKKATTYKMQGFREGIYRRTYWLVVVQSSQLDERKARRLAKQVEDKVKQWGHVAYVMLLALLAYALLQQRVRRGLALEQAKHPLVLNGVKVASPTGRTIVEEFEIALHMVIRMPDRQVMHRLQGIMELGARILQYFHLKKRPLLTGGSLLGVSAPNYRFVHYLDSI